MCYHIGVRMLSIRGVRSISIHVSINRRIMSRVSEQSCTPYRDLTMRTHRRIRNRTRSRGVTRNRSRSRVIVVIRMNSMRVVVLLVVVVLCVYAFSTGVFVCVY